MPINVPMDHNHNKFPVRKMLQHDDMLPIRCKLQHNHNTIQDITIDLSGNQYTISHTTFGTLKRHDFTFRWLGKSAERWNNSTAMCTMYYQYNHKVNLRN